MCPRRHAGCRWAGWTKRTGLHWPLRCLCEIRAALAALLQQIQDPASPHYHHYLTPDEFTAQFGPTIADYQAVTAFAEAKGLHVTSTHPNRLLLDVSGSVSAVERALRVTMRTYQHPTEQRTFYAPDTAPAIDLATPILGISGLDNYELPRPRFVARPSVNGQQAKSDLGSGPGGAYMGNDFRKAYVPDTTLTGFGQMVGLLQFDGYTPADITYYESKTGLPNVPLQNVLLDGFSGNPTFTGGEVEVSLDIEMSLSMAPNLSKIIVYEAGPAGSWHDILNRMADDNLARQMSCSWFIPGGVADPVADQIFQQMAAQGQSFFCASGDDDAYTGLISFPSDSPYITLVGGTTLTTTGPGGQYVTETVWNWEDGIGSGGGISTQYPIPSWQKNISMTANQGSTTKRNVPDVALTADNIYVRADGADYNYGGTSFASPLWAGFTALVNGQAAASGKAAVGFINPALDTIGKSATYTACFHDTTAGNNESLASPGRFSAAASYDLCTGWGTPAGQNLINALAYPEALVITPLTGFTASGGVGGPFTQTSQIFTLTNIGTNTLTWSLASTSVWLRVSSLGGTLAAGSTTTVTASLNANASNLVVGTYSATIWFTNMSDQIGQSRAFTLSVIQPPVITTQPTNVTVLEGEPAAFSITATGGQPLTYQWQDNGTNLTDGGGISGSTTSNLVFASVSASEAGTYAIVVTNAAGAVISADALLTIPTSPPVFTLEPTNQTVYASENVEFAVAVVGSEPYSYQWNFNSTAIPGATNATLTLTDLQLDQSGDYSVLVTNAYGATDSSIAALTVNPPPPCAPVSAGMVDWWAGEGNANDSVGTNNGTLVGGVAFAPGEVGQAFVFDGSSGYVSIPDSPSLDSFVTNITIELWLRVNQATPNADWRGIVTKGNSSWRLQGTSGAETVTFSADPNGDLKGNAEVNDGQWHHVAATYDGTNMCLYVDGTLDATQPASLPLATNSFPVCLGENPQAPNPYYFNGSVDEVTLYNRALSADEIQTIYITGSGGKCPLPIAITFQPTNETVNAGGTATFTVAATGSQPMSYQWSFDGIPIDNATNSVFTLEDVQSTNDGVYAVTLTNPYESVMSSNAVLTVPTYPPSIITQPINQTNYAGTTASFSVTANGSQPLSYQWSFDGTSLDGATNATLMLSDVQSGEAGEYSVSVSNPYGETNSVTAMLTVAAPPNCAPVSEGMVSWWAGEGNANDSFGTNNGTLEGGVTFVPGEVGQAFMFDGSSGYVSIPDSPSLDSFGTNITIECWIMVNQNTPNADWTGIVTKGNSSWRLQGTSGAETVTFSADPNGDLIGNAEVNDGQWHHVAATYDGTNMCLYVDGTLDATQPASLPLATNSFPVCLGENPQAPPGYYFNGAIDEVAIYNRALSAEEIQTIYVTGSGGKCPVPIVVASQPTNETINAGSAVSWSVAATGSRPLTYQWNFEGTPLAGATNTVFTIEDAQPTNAGVYTVTLTNPFQSVTSSNALLTVLARPPTIVTQPASQTNNPGATVNFIVVAGGTPPFGYQWSFDRTNMIGATNSALTLTNVQLSQAGNYAVVVTNLYGSVTSSNSVLTLLPQPPIILAQPVSETNVVGGTASFTVIASGTLPLSYQWRFGTSNIIGATSATLTLLEVQPSQAGNYTVLITNLFGSTNSATAVLTVNSTPSCDPAPSGIVSWWPGDGNADDIVGTNNGVLEGGVTFVAGEVGQAFMLNGSSSYVSIPDSPSLDSCVTGITIECWIKVNQTTINADWRGIVTKGNNSWRLQGTSGAGTIYFASDGVSPGLKGNRNINDEQWHHVAATYNGTEICLYVDGVLDASTPASGLMLQDSYPVCLGANADAPNLYLFNGAIDAVSIYNSALSASQIAAIYDAGSGGKCSPSPPEIILQPTNEVVIVGSTASLDVAATSSFPLNYQWCFNGTNLLGATNQSLVMTNVQFAQAGNYSVWVTNVYGSILSSNAQVAVTPAFHFAWNSIPSPRFEGTPFTVVVQAQNVSNGIATNFTSSVALASTNGVPIIPAVSANFVQGVWTGAVTIAQTTTNLVLQATDGFGETGLANPVNIVNRPMLTTLPSGGSLLMLWPVNPSGFLLETTPRLFPANWVPISTTPFQIGNQNLLSLPASGTNAFYRLYFPGP
jgi:hypothetical protein